MEWKFQIGSFFNWKNFPDFCWLVVKFGTWYGRKHSIRREANKSTAEIYKAGTPFLQFTGTKKGELSCLPDTQGAQAFNGLDSLINWSYLHQLDGLLSLTKVIIPWCCSHYWGVLGIQEKSVTVFLWLWWSIVVIWSPKQSPFLTPFAATRTYLRWDWSLIFLETILCLTDVAAKYPPFVCMALNLLLIMKHWKFSYQVSVVFWHSTIVHLFKVRI